MWKYPPSSASPFQFQIWRRIDRNSYYRWVCFCSSHSVFSKDIYTPSDLSALGNCFSSSRWWSWVRAALIGALIAAFLSPLSEVSSKHLSNNLKKSITRNPSSAYPLLLPWKEKALRGNSPSLMNLFAVDEQSSKHEQIIPTFEGGGAICRSGGLQEFNSPIHLCLLAIFRFFLLSYVPPFLKSRWFFPKWTSLSPHPLP